VQDEPLTSGEFWQPRTGSQLSFVQTLLSLQLRAVPAAQVPAWHVSLPLQTFPSAHDVPFVTGALEHPKTGSQESVVQRFESLQVRGVPLVQTPAWQVSPPLQTSPSAHEVPFRTGVAWQPLTGSQLSVVQTLPSLQVSDAPAAHVPL